MATRIDRRFAELKTATAVQPTDWAGSWVSSHFLVSNQPTTGSVLLPLENQIVPFLSNCR